MPESGVNLLEKVEMKLLQVIIKILELHSFT